MCFTNCSNNRKYHWKRCNFCWCCFDLFWLVTLFLWFVTSSKGIAMMCPNLSIHSQCKTRAIFNQLLLEKIFSCSTFSFSNLKWGFVSSFRLSTADTPSNQAWLSFMVHNCHYEGHRLTGILHLYEATILPFLVCLTLFCVVVTIRMLLQWINVFLNKNFRMYCQGISLCLGKSWHTILGKSQWTSLTWEIPNGLHENSWTTLDVLWGVPSTNYCLPPLPSYLPA